MSLPASLTTISLRGTFYGYDGSPAKGSILVYSTEHLVSSVDNAIVGPTMFEVQLDANGYFERIIPATNDPQWSPLNYTYVVKESLSTGVRTYRIAVPFDTPGGVLDLADVSPVQNNPEPTTYVLASTANQNGGYPRIDATTGKIPSSVIPPGGGNADGSFKGTWSGATAYIAGDIVVRSGDTYGAIQNSTNQDPVTQPTYWTALPVSSVGGTVTSVFGRTGVVTAAANDYAIADITGLSAALGSLQPSDADLAAIAGLTPADNDLLQRKAGAWTNRTLAQVAADLDAAHPTVVLSDTTAPAPVANTLTLYSYNLAGQSRLRVMTPEGVPVSILRDQLAVGRNESGTTITKMTPVYISGVFTGTENIPIVSRAKADAAATANCVGIAWEDIANNGYGRVMSLGRIDNVDTSAWTVNSILYVSATAAGTLTTTRPTHPNYRQAVGFVLRSHASQGSIAVAVGGVGGTGDGTNSNSWTIGDAGTGAKSIVFKNANSLTLQANPTGTRTLTLPDATGTVALTASPAFTGTATAVNVTMSGRQLNTPVALTPGATVAVDASLGNQFTLTANQNFTLFNPTNLVDGQMILFVIRQDATGSRVITLDTIFRLGSDISSVVLSTGANKTDYIGCRYNGTDSKLDVIAFVKGY